MNSYDEKLAHAIKIRFGTFGAEPTQPQLNAIKNEIEKKAFPTEQDWFSAVLKHCPTAGSCVYKGLDNSDLNTLLKIALQMASRN